MTRQKVLNLHVVPNGFADLNSNFGPAGIDSELLPGRTVLGVCLLTHVGSVRLSRDLENEVAGKSGLLLCSEFSCLAESQCTVSEIPRGQC